MPRLNQRALAILQAELKKSRVSNPLSQTVEPIILKRLYRLQTQTGEPATAAELREVIADLIPDFNPAVLKAAAQANRASGGWVLIPGTLGAIASAVGLVYIINLPYPMIRLPVSRVAPILLLPSYLQMDRSYRGAIAAVEQADQLINQATSAADLDLGEHKVKEAQKHLEGLPVWFLGYYPRAYCSFLGGCTWRFTLDEFEGARKQVGRMEARVFQEKNAQKLLVEGDRVVQTAQQQYRQASASPERQQAITAWQTGLDQLTQIPPETLAGRQARPKLAAYQRDFQQVSGSTSGTQRTNNLIEAAKQFGLQAAQLSQNPPHSSAQWEQITNLWADAIAQLQQVSADDPGYVDAIKQLAQYKTNLGIAQTRLAAEQESSRALQQAKEQIADWQRLAGSKPNRGELASQLQSIINQLEQVKPGTTATAEAQTLRQFAQKQFQALQ